MHVNQVLVDSDIVKATVLASTILTIKFFVASTIQGGSLF
jgi:hypothetical protein